MSFITVIEKDLTDIETGVVNGLKTALNYVDNIVVTELLPALETALHDAIAKFGQEAIANILSAISQQPTNPPAPPAA